MKRHEKLEELFCSGFRSVREIKREIERSSYFACNCRTRRVNSLQGAEEQVEGIQKLTSNFCELSQILKELENNQLDVRLEDAGMRMDLDRTKAAVIFRVQQKEACGMGYIYTQLFKSVASTTIEITVSDVVTEKELREKQEETLSQLGAAGLCERYAAYFSQQGKVAEEWLDYLNEEI